MKTLGECLRDLFDAEVEYRMTQQASLALEQEIDPFGHSTSTAAEMRAVRILEEEAEAEQHRNVALDSLLDAYAKEYELVLPGHMDPIN